MWSLNHHSTHSNVHAFYFSPDWLLHHSGAVFLFFPFILHRVKLCNDNLIRYLIDDLGLVCMTEMFEWNTNKYNIKNNKFELQFSHGTTIEWHLHVLYRWKQRHMRRKKRTEAGHFKQVHKSVSNFYQWIFMNRFYLTVSGLQFVLPLGAIFFRSRHLSIRFWVVQPANAMKRIFPLCYTFYSVFIDFKMICYSATEILTSFISYMTKRVIILGSYVAHTCMWRRRSAFYSAWSLQFYSSYW